ncbi:MAG: hypothetical protein PHQ40_01440 [Anaerolineaceae bacterium]|nr:hypothetical protein [Anaerolineaceae bacterium]
MLNRSRELWLALFAIGFITLIYLFMTAISGGAPAASEFYGHSIGILGFLLMLMTESLYTLRKRSHSARWGRMSSWLDFHIFTGLVGPFMVLLHSSWKFNGIAGVLMLLTIVIVVSGFIGRFIYTRVPRTADGAELQVTELEALISDVDAQLQSMQSPDQTSSEKVLALNAVLEGSEGVDPANARLEPSLAEKKHQMEALSKQRDQVRREISGLASARRLLAIWHAVHIPIGLALFGLAFVHVVAAIYFAELLK